MVSSIFRGFVSNVNFVEFKILQDLGLNNQKIDESQQFIVDWCERAYSTREYDNRIIAAKRILTCSALEQTKLDLEGLSLTTLPQLNLPNLERLELQNNELRELPAQLNLPNLRSLYLENNELRELPAQLNLPNLKLLDLQNNGLRELPAHLSLPNLWSLHLQDNELRELPAQMSLPKLRWLYLENSGLRELPAYLSLPNLRSLHLQNNPQLAQLPLSLAQSWWLGEIHIDGTQILHSQVEQILTACQHLKNLEAVQALPHLLKLWSDYAESSVERLQFISYFSDEEKQDIHEWLIRLSRNQDFSSYQRELAKIVYGLLGDLTDEGFKELFLSQRRANVDHPYPVFIYAQIALAIKLP